MQLVAWIALVVFWFAWGYPFIFRVPLKQRRQTIHALGSIRVGLLLEGIAIFLAFAFRLPPESSIGLERVLPALLLGPVAAALSWNSVKHLGKQFRVHGSGNEDQVLVRTGPYALVRHPVYSSLLAMLLCTVLILTPWEWAVVALGLFIAGTEIRVRTEDKLMAARFGEEFTNYRAKVPAYLPFVR